MLPLFKSGKQRNYYLHFSSEFKGYGPGHTDLVSERFIWEPSPGIVISFGYVFWVYILVIELNIHFLLKA